MQNTWTYSEPMEVWPSWWGSVCEPPGRSAVCRSVLWPRPPGSARVRCRRSRTGRGTRPCPPCTPWPVHSSCLVRPCWRDGRGHGSPRRGWRRCCSTSMNRAAPTVEVYRLALDPGAHHLSVPHGPGVVEHLLVTRGRARVGRSGEAGRDRRG